MSDITKLTEKITQDAAKKSAAVLAAGEKEIQQREMLQKKQLQQQSDEKMIRLEKEAQAELSLRVSDLHVKSRSKLLATKQAVLDELFTEALQQLRQLSAKDFNAFMTSNLAKINLTGSAELLIGELSQRYVTADSLKRWQAAVNNELQLTISEQIIPQRGGFILRQGEIEFNFIFESILNASEEDLSNELLQLIFAEA